MKDEIAKQIVDELRLIREELQNLTMAIRSKVTNSEHSYADKSRKSYLPCTPYPPNPGQSEAKPHRNARPGRRHYLQERNLFNDKELVIANGSLDGFHQRHGSLSVFGMKAFTPIFLASSIRRLSASLERMTIATSGFAKVTQDLTVLSGIYG